MKVLHILPQSLPLFHSNPWDGWHARIARELLNITDEHTMECWHVERTLRETWSKTEDGIDFKLFPSTFIPGIGLERSSPLVRELRERLKCGGNLLVHVHGAFWSLTHDIARCCTDVPLVVSIYLNRFPWFSEVSMGMRTGNALGAARSLAMRPIEDWSERRSFSNVDRLIVLNSLLKSYYAGVVGPDRVEVIPLGIHFERFQPMDMMEARKRLGLERNRRYVLYVGAMVKWKGLEFLLRALPEVLRHYPETMLLLGGDGYSRPGLEKLAVREGIAEQTRFLGYMDNRSLPLWYNAADVCVLPSWNEALGVVAIEALACDRPYIGTNVGGIPDILRSFDSGIVIPPRDSSAISQAIVRALAHPESFMVDRASGQKHYRWENISRDILRVYDKVSLHYADSWGKPRRRNS
ncbi:MAG: glycosyltransferase [Chloroflexota bacterium]